MSTVLKPGAPINGMKSWEVWGSRFIATVKEDDYGYVWWVQGAQGHWSNSHGPVTWSVALNEAATAVETLDAAERLGADVRKIAT